MKLLQALLLVLAISSTAFAGCPFGFDKLQKDNLRKPVAECPNGQVLINGACQTSIINLTGTSENVSDLLTFTYSFPDSNSIDITLTLKQNSWVGIGFGSSMEDTDMVLTNVNGNSVEVYEAYSTGHKEPTKMEDQSAIKVTGSTVTSDSVTVSFNRLLAPVTQPGQPEFAQLSPNTDQAFIFAYGAKAGQDTVQYHGKQNKFSVKYFLSNTNSACPSGQVLVNGACQENIVKLTGTSEIVSDLLTFTYSFPDTTSIDITLTLQQNSWVGIGFGSSMKDTDMVLVDVDGDNVDVYEAFSTGHKEPTKMEDQSAITVKGHTVTPSSVTVTFNRLLAPVTQPGQPEFAKLTPNTDQPFIFAYGAKAGQDTVQYHGKQNRFSVKYYLSDANSVLEEIVQEVYSFFASFY